MSSQRSGVLELAVLGVLHELPVLAMYGDEVARPNCVEHLTKLLALSMACDVHVFANGR